MQSRFFSLVAAAAVLLLGALATPVQAQTVVVTNTNDDGLGSLRAAIAVVNAGNANVIDMTGLSGTLTLDSSLPSILNDAAIIGAGPGLTIVGVLGNEVSLGASANVTMTDFVIGDAFTKQGSGTLEWSGSGQSYTEGTSIGNGTLRTTTSNLLSAYSETSVSAGAVLDLAGTTQSVGDLWVEEGALVDLGAGTLTIDGSAFAGSLVAGTLAGAGGSLHLTGDATFVVGAFGSGQGTYTGTTRASGNAYVLLGADQVLSAQSGLLLEDDAFVELDGAHTFASLAGTGGELFLCDCTSVTFDQDIDTTFSGALSGDAASTFSKAGTGRLALTGDGSGFLGLMDVSGGVLQGTTDSLVNDIVNDATVEFNQDFDGAYAGDMSGSGALVKAGTGTVTLEGSNTYSGPTTVTGGSLAAGGDFTLSAVSALTVGAGGTLDVTDTLQEIGSLAGEGTVTFGNSGEISMGGDNTSTAFSGTITGGSSSVLEKVGTGTFTLGSGAAVSIGALVVDEGTVALNEAGAGSGIDVLYVGGAVTLGADYAVGDLVVGNVFTGGGVVDLGAHTLSVDGGTITSAINGTITGAGGSLHLSGTVEMYFGGFIPDVGLGTYTGSTTVSGNAYLGLRNDQALSAETTLIINDNATLELEGTHTYSGLSGNGGTLFMCECVSLTIDQDADSTFAGEITDDGFFGGATFTKAGSGRLMLSGFTSHIGGTEVLGGTLAGTTDSLQGDILNDATLEFDQDFDGEFDGYISGTGQVVKSGTGILELLSGNDYTGGTVMNAGSLVAGQDFALGSGALTMNGGHLFIWSEQQVTSLSGAGGELEVAMLLSIDQDIDTSFTGGLSGNGAIGKAGEGTLTMSGAKDFEGAVGVFGGTVALGGTTSVLSDAAGVVISDDGRLELLSDQSLHDVLLAGRLDVGSHTLTLDTQSGSIFLGNVTGNGRIIVDGVGMLAQGQSDFSGNLTLSGSTMSAFVSDNVFSHASLTINDDAILDMEGLQQIRGLSGNGGELFLCFCAALVVDQNFDTMFRGRLAGDEGSIFVKAGSGRLMLAGNSSDFFGVMGVVEGVLAGTTSSLVGDIANFATLEFAQDEDGEFSNEIFGTGALVKSGAGTLLLSGRNTYLGGTTIAGGTLLVASDENLGAATGGLTFDGGTLGILADFGSDRDVTLAGAGTFDTGEHDAFLAGDIAGAGSLTKKGAGSLFLDGASSYTGGTTVLDGVLGGTASSLRGSIANSGVVFFDQQRDGIFGGTISGSGSVVKAGAGALSVNTPQTYTGATFVTEGTLHLNSTLAGPVFVGDATFGFATGSPAFASAALSGAGGGAAAGPADIGGDLLLTSGAVYSTPVGPDATVATLNVAGVAAIDGATLHLAVEPAGVAPRRQSSTLIEAASIEGAFGAVTGLGASLDSYLFSDESRVRLLLLRNDVDFSEYAETLNGSAVGGALAEAQSAGGGSDDLRFITRELAALGTDEELGTALDRLSGGAHGSLAGISMIASADVIDVLTTRLTGQGGWWLQGLGSSLSLEADVDPGASTTTMRGMMAGYDRRWSGAMAGVSAGFTDNDIDASGGLDRLDGRAYRAAAYGQVSTGHVVIDGIVSAASHRVSGSRGISFAATLEPEFGGGLLFGGVDRTASFDYDAFEIAAVADAGYRMQAGGFSVQPAVGMQFTRVSRDDFSETGAGALDLTAAASDVSSAAARARLSVERRFTRASGRWFAPRVGVRYTRELGDRDVPFAASIAGAPFTASGFALPGSLFAARAGVAAGLGAVTFSLDYRAAVAAGHRHHLVSAGFGF